MLEHTLHLYQSVFFFVLFFNEISDHPALTLYKPDQRQTNQKKKTVCPQVVTRILLFYKWCIHLLFFLFCFVFRRLFFGVNEISVKVPSLFKLLIKEVGPTKTLSLTPGLSQIVY